MRIIEMTRSLLLLSLILAACGESASPKAESQDLLRESASPTKTCTKDQEKKISEMTSALLKFADRQVILDPQVDLPEVASSWSTQEDDGLPVELGREGMVVFAGDPPIAGWREDTTIADEVEKGRVMAGHRGSEYTPRVLAAIAGDMPAEDVDEFLMMLRRAGVEQVVVVAKPKDAPSIPANPKPELVEEFRRLAPDPSQRASAIADMMVPQVDLCPPLGEAFAAVASTSADRRGRVLLEGAKEALVECGCAADVDVMLGVFHMMTVPPSITTFSPPLKLVREGEDAKGSLVVPKGTPWRELVTALYDEPRAELSLRVIEPGDL